MHCSWIWVTISYYWGLNFSIKNKVGTLQKLGCGHCTARASMIPIFLLFFFFFSASLITYCMSFPGSSLFSSVQFSHSVMSDSLWPHEAQHTRPPCPSPTPGVYPNSCALSQWCHPTTSSSVIPFSCPQSFPASGSFQMSHLLITCTLKLVFIKALPKPLGPYPFVLQSSSMRLLTGMKVNETYSSYFRIL